jgi:hypothetical protein
MLVINCNEVRQAKKKLNYRNTQSWSRLYVNFSEFHSFKTFQEKKVAYVMNACTKFSSYEALDTLVAILIKVQRVCFTNQTLNACNHTNRYGSNKRLYPGIVRCTHPLQKIIISRGPCLNM